MYYIFRALDFTYPKSVSRRVKVLFENDFSVYLQCSKCSLYDPDGTMATSQAVKQKEKNAVSVILHHLPSDIIHTSHSNCFAESFVSD